MTFPSAVSLKNVKKSYGKGNLRFEVLHQVNLEVKHNELLMLVGPSGSGKTTLISIIAGILGYDEGECTIFGQNFGDLSDDEKTEFRKQHIGYVFQSFNLIPMLTAAENISIPLLLGGMKREEALQAAKIRLEQFGLKKRADAYPNELSGGEQQRIAIARAVIHSPELIVCDEPTSALDQESGQLILSHLREIVSKEHKALVVVTHDSRIFDFADRIAYLEDGHIKL
jgi:putative ABC transport system ATP-binding protein